MIKELYNLDFYIYLIYYFTLFFYKITLVKSIFIKLSLFYKPEKE